MSIPSTPEDDETRLKDQAKYAHSRLADMLVKAELSPYQPMPDVVVLNYPEPPFSAAVRIVLTAADLKTPDPKLNPSNKSAPKKRR